MSLSTPFIERPIATTLLTVAVALLVCLAILTLPLSPFDRERLLARWRRRGER